MLQMLFWDTRFWPFKTGFSLREVVFTLLISGVQTFRTFIVLTFCPASGLCTGFSGISISSRLSSNVAVNRDYYNECLC